MEAFIGTILSVGFNFPPYGWQSCQGQTLPVSQYQAVYALLGNQFGGNQANFGLPDLRGRFPLGFGTGPSLTPRVMGATGGLEATSQVPAHIHPAGGVTPLTGSASGSPTLPFTTNVSLPVTVTGPMLGTTEVGQQDAPFQDSMVADLNPGSSPKLYTKPANPTATTVNMATMTSTGTATGAVSGNASGPVTFALSGPNLTTTVTVQPNTPGGAAAIMNPFVAVNYIICIQGIYPTRQ